MNSCNTSAVAAQSEMLSAQEIHRGLVDASGNVVVPCSKEFLVSLALAVLRARSFPLTRLLDTFKSTEELKDFEKKYREVCQAQIQRLQMISAEIRRLFQWPALFPSRAFRTKFAALVALDSNLQFVQATSSLLIRKVKAEVDEEFRQKAAKTYMKGSKGWENFYLNMAPGVYGDTEAAHMETTPRTALQVIPAVGIRVMGDLGREEQMLLQWIRDAQVPVASEPALTTKLLDLENPEVEGRLQEQTAINQQCIDGTLLPNPFNPGETAHWDVPVQAPEALEEFTIFIGRLESMPLPPQAVFAQMHTATLFRAIRLRTWHPPTKVDELRYNVSDAEMQEQ
ncbi:hypothetical protein LTS17_008549 [Exophiala oligosperma]